MQANTTPSAEALKKLGISPEELQPASAEEKAMNDQMRPSISYWKDAMRRFTRNKLAMVRPTPTRGRASTCARGRALLTRSAPTSWAATYSCA